MDNVAAHIPPSSEDRQQPRTHLFVAATLNADGRPAAVHIRNMSQSGALIEGAELPDVGFRIVLKRGPLQATGHIAWRVDRRAGVRFETAVYVSDWMTRQVSAGQERVDATVEVFKANGYAARGSTPASIEAELLHLRADLAYLGSALIADVIVVATHPEIQAIDISLQRIDRVLKRLRNGG